MNLRQWLNENPAVSTVAAVVLLVLCIGFVLYQVGAVGGPQVSGNKYFYDRNTGELFVDSSEKVPPITTDSGEYDGQPAGVVARIYACGECGSYHGMTPEEVEEAGARIGVLEMYPIKIKEVMENGNWEQIQQPPDAYRQLRRPQDEQWISASSQQGIQLERNAPIQCEDQTQIRTCLP